MRRSPHPRPSDRIETWNEMILALDVVYDLLRQLAYDRSQRSLFMRQT